MRDDRYVDTKVTLTQLEHDTFKWLKTLPNQRCLTSGATGNKLRALNALCKKNLVGRIKGERTSKSYQPEYFKVIVS
ncbi:MAG: hypothetical protein V4501_08190 [Pseudomonadota bacterium]